jgi:hypothetical protein
MLFVSLLTFGMLTVNLLKNITDVSGLLTYLLNEIAGLIYSHFE